MLSMGDNFYNGLHFNIVQEGDRLRVYSPDANQYYKLPDASGLDGTLPLFDMAAGTSLIQIEMLLCDGMDIPRPGFAALPTNKGVNLLSPRDPQALLNRVPAHPEDPDEADLPTPLAEPDLTGLPAEAAPDPDEPATPAA